MEKTRFYQLTQSELHLLNDYLKRMRINNYDENLRKLNGEIQQQIYLNEWSKKEIEIKNEIEKTENQIQELQKRLNDYKKLLNN